jgi:hypothetical protein
LTMPKTESVMERGYCKAVREGGGEAYKFVSPGRRGVPDRLTLYPVPPKHRVIVAQYIQFAELKAAGKKPTRAQKREHERLRALGFKVVVLDKMPSNVFVEGIDP